MAKKIYDNLFVSTQAGEISYICNLFKSPKSGDGVPKPLLYFILNEMGFNKGKVFRTRLYDILTTMGYVKAR